MGKRAVGLFFFNSLSLQKYNLMAYEQRLWFINLHSNVTSPIISIRVGEIM